MTHIPAPALESERVITAAPMSFTGSARRIWRMTGGRSGWPLAGMITLAVLTIIVAWAGVLCWYALFGVLLVPYRIVRRVQRDNRRKALRHREMLAAARRVGDS